MIGPGSDPYDDPPAGNGEDGLLDAALAQGGEVTDMGPDDMEDKDGGTEERDED